MTEMSEKRSVYTYICTICINRYFFLFYFKDKMRILSISLCISTLTNTFSTFYWFSFTLFVRNKHYLGYTPGNHVASRRGKRSKIAMGGCNMVAFRPLFWLFPVQHGCIKAYIHGSCVDICAICVDFAGSLCRLCRQLCHNYMTISDKVA
jgi:hypothetical protein